MAPSFDEYKVASPSPTETPEKYLVSDKLIPSSAVKLEDTMREILPQDQFHELKDFTSLLTTEGMKTLVEGTLYGKGNGGSHFWLIPSSVEENEDGETTANFTLIKSRPSEDAKVSQIEVITPKGEEGIHKLKGVITTLTELGDDGTGGVKNYRANADEGHKPQGTVRLIGTQFLANDNIDVKDILHRSVETIGKAQEERWFPFYVVTVQQLADAFNGNFVKEVGR